MSPNRFTITAATILVLVTFSVYFGVFWNDFVDYDDNLYVRYNKQTLAGLSPSTFYYAWTTTDTGNWIPLTWLSYQLDVTLFGKKPAGFLATNVVLHAANVLLLLTWLTRVSIAKWRCFLVALLYAVHPLHVESVAWIAERKDVLCTFWVLVTLHGYERYAANPTAKWYLATSIAFALALLAKPMAVSLPLLLIAIDYWPLNRWRLSKKENKDEHRYVQFRPSRLIVEKVPMLCLSLLDGAMTFYAQSQTTAFRLPGSSILDRIGGVGINYIWYLAKTIVPTELMALYPRPINEVPWYATIASFIILSGITIHAIVHRDRRRHLLFGWIWFLTSLLPVVGLLQVGMQSHADRYTYIPHIGLFVMFVWEATFWVNCFPQTRSIAIAATAIAILAFSVQTTSQVAVWRTTETLWQHAISIEPQHPLAHGSLAVHLLETGRYDEGEAHFAFFVNHYPGAKASTEKFIAIYRKYGGKPEEESQFRTELGTYYANERSTEMARIEFEKAVSISPDNHLARYQLGVALAGLGRLQEARSHLEMALTQMPDNVGVHAALAVVLEQLKEYVASRDQFEIVDKLSPGHPATIEKLKSLNQRLGR